MLWKKHEKTTKNCKNAQKQAQQRENVSSENLLVLDFSSESELLVEVI